MMDIKVHILHCGTVGVDASMIVNDGSKNPLAILRIFRGGKHRVWLPVSAYLIEHPKGLVLIDTGWHTDVRINQKKHLGWFHSLINKAELPQGQAITEQLAKLGYRPKDIDYVVFSHLHSDHVSGVQLVKDAQKILVSEEEWQDTIDNRINYIPSMWNGISFEKFKFSSSSYGPFGLSFDLFGDDSVIFVYTPGHTNGLAATIIKNNEKHILLTSDIAYSKEAWKQQLLSTLLTDKEKAKKSLHWVKEMSADPNCIEVVVNHDVNEQPKVITL